MSASRIGFGPVFAVGSCAKRDIPRGRMPSPVFVASMQMRGAHAPPPPGFGVVRRVNVTSSQAKNSPDRLTFSPMNGVPYADADEGAFPMGFEAYWQSLKVVEGLDHDERKRWWRSIKKCKRRDPKLKKKHVLHARHKRFPGRELNYVESRKLVYVPDYYALIKDAPRFLAIQREVQQGDDNTAVVVFDFDGPKTPGGGVACEKVTVDALRARISDTAFPFGHGFVVAAALAGIAPEAYVG